MKNLLLEKKESLGKCGNSGKCSALQLAKSSNLSKLKMPDLALKCRNRNFTVTLFFIFGATGKFKLTIFSSLRHRDPFSKYLVSFAIYMVLVPWQSLLMENSYYCKRNFSTFTYLGCKGQRVATYPKNLPVCILILLCFAASERSIFQQSLSLSVHIQGLTGLQGDLSTRWCIDFYAYGYQISTFWICCIKKSRSQNSRCTHTH